MLRPVQPQGVIWVKKKERMRLMANTSPTAAMVATGWNSTPSRHGFIRGLSLSQRFRGLGQYVQPRCRC